MRHILVFATALLLWGTVSALADEVLLSVDSGTPELYEHLTTDGHYVRFESPAGWQHVFTQELSFYGHRYGDVAGRRGTLIIWSRGASAPQTTRTPRPRPGAPPPAAAPADAVIHLRAQFDLAAVPEQPGWFSLPLEAVELPRNFGVSLFTFSNDNSGVKLALAAPQGRNPSRSSVGMPAQMTASPISYRRDGRNWMVRLTVRDALRLQDEFNSTELAGPKFAVHDDGVADGFATTQRDGPIVRFTSDGNQRLRRIFVHGRLEGNWFNTDREAGVWLLDANHGIVWYGKLPYRRFTSVPSWGYVEVPDMVAPRVFHVLVEPVSRPNLKLLIGYDASSPNRGSLFGNAGAPQIWAIDAPEDRTNWMIRVEYR